jgi:hypothetical protein
METIDKVKCSLIKITIQLEGLWRPVIFKWINQSKNYVNFESYIAVNLPL